jgi:hypothetical protein
MGHSPSGEWNRACDEVCQRTEENIMSRSGIAARFFLAPLLICACSGHEPSNSDQSDEPLLTVRAEVSRVVPDSDRRKRLYAALDRYENELRTFNSVVSELQNGLRALNADPAAPRAGFTELVAKYEVERKATRARLLQAHLELLSLTTDDEWRSIAKREVDALRLADAGKPR